MTISSKVPHRSRRLIRAAAHGSVYCALLLPVAVAALTATLCGRTDAAARWWQRLPTGVPGDPRLGHAGSSTAKRTAGHALLSLLLGVAALVPLGIELLFVLRGVLYGLVDPGPYDDSWGGPSRAGAWLAHFLVGVPVLIAAALALAGIAAVHHRLTAVLDGRRPARWVWPVALVIPLPFAAFFVAWLHQI